MEIENIQLVHPISEYYSLAQIDCINNIPNCEYKKYKTLFINKSNEIVADFQSSEFFKAEQLVADNEKLYDITIKDKNKIKHQVIRIENGKQVLLNTYDNIELGEEDGTFAVQKDGLWGFIDTNGDEIIKPKYDKYKPFYNGIAIVEKNKNRGYVNKQGTEITPLKYWHCQPFYGDITVADNYDLTIEVINKNGKVLFKSKPHQEIFNLGNASILIEKQNKKFEIIKFKE